MAREKHGQKTAINLVITDLQAGVSDDLIAFLSADLYVQSKEMASDEEERRDHHPGHHHHHHHHHHHGDYDELHYHHTDLDPSYEYVFPLF